MTFVDSACIGRVRLPDSCEDEHRSLTCSRPGADPLERVMSMNEHSFIVPLTRRALRVPPEPPAGASGSIETCDGPFIGTAVSVEP